jgi:hypothetical protein
VALYHLPDARLKLVEEAEPGVVANRRTKTLNGAEAGWPVAFSFAIRSAEGHANDFVPVFTKVNQQVAGCFDAGRFQRE